MKSAYNIETDISEVVCVKDFKEPDNVPDSTNFIKGKVYKYWINFGGLNHIVQDDNNHRYPFRGHTAYPDDRPLIWDYFQKVDDYRDDQINKIL